MHDGRGRGAMPVDERTFVSKVASWVDQILARRPDLPYAEAKVEEHGFGTHKRHDFKLLRRVTNDVALTGEVKMPDNPEGRTPLADPLVDDAFEKASRLGTDYYFTWNVRELALFRTHESGVPYNERVVEVVTVVDDVTTSDQTERPDVQDRIKGFWERLLERLHRIERGEEDIRNLPLDQRFIRRLEAALEEPVALIFDELARRYKADARFRKDPDAWMRDEQGWELSAQPEVERRNLERASRLSCYALTNRLVFYEVVRRRFPTLRPLCRPVDGSTGLQLRDALEAQFREAIAVSRDYETIFESAGFGSQLPYLSDAAVPHWGRLIGSIGEFDFTQLDYDIIGRMYEDLIGPAERTKYGQFFTMPEVVDLINAFCVRDAAAKVMDPACGGGTFLVRAYARKKALAQRQGREFTHLEVLADLFGVDIAAFPAQLSTINLAVRHLADEPNYPQVVRKDFFDIRPGLPAITLPVGGGDGATGECDVTIASLDAVVGNPPYVRQEEMGKDYKSRLRRLAREEWPGSDVPDLSGRSDIYVFFFAHGGAFLKDGGRLGLVTSVGWLDTEYGFRLQEFFLKHFRIIAVMESQVEKWFEDARVTTAVTILQKEPNESRRRDNFVRFIQLRRPLAEIYTEALKGPVSEASEAARQRDMDAIRDLIEEITNNQTTDYWRVRVVRQGDLWDIGCRARLGDESVSAAKAVNGYKAGKWGQYLRAPDIYFELLGRCPGRFVPVGELAEVRRGFTSGVDKFFCVRDVTDEELRRTPDPAAFRRKWAIRPADTTDVRVVRDGEGRAHLVEARFLELEFHRLTEANRIVVKAQDVRKKVINAPISRAALRDTWLERYVDYAERRGWNSGSTVASRARTRPWYDLGLLPKSKRAQMFWPMAQQYRHLVPLNQNKMAANHNLFDLWPRNGLDCRLLWAVLNSTVVALSKHQFGRPAGIEGSLKTEVVDVNMMLVPDPRNADPSVAKRVVAAATRLSRRLLRRMLPEEFELADRRELDDAVLELLGIANGEERATLRARIYAALEEQYAATRARELVAQKDRLRSKRKGVVTPADMADEIWQSEESTLNLMEFPSDFLRRRTGLTAIDLPPGKVEVGRAMMETGRDLRAGTIRVGGPSGTVIDVGSRARAEFVSICADCGLYGELAVPAEDEECEQAIQHFHNYSTQLRTRFEALAAEHTRDTKKQKAIVNALMRHALSWRRSPSERQEGE